MVFLKAMHSLLATAQEAAPQQAGTEIQIVAMVPEYRS